MMSAIEFIEMIRETTDEIKEYFFERNGYLNPTERAALNDLSAVCGQVGEFASKFDEFIKEKNKYLDRKVKGL